MFFSGVRAHRLLQHVNDLAKERLSSLFRIYAPTLLSQNRCDNRGEGLGRLLF
jgi:hypothetical protein